MEVFSGRWWNNEAMRLETVVVRGNGENALGKMEKWKNERTKIAARSFAWVAWVAWP